MKKIIGIIFILIFLTGCSTIQTEPEQFAFNKQIPLPTDMELLEQMKLLPEYSGVWVNDDLIIVMGDSSVPLSWDIPRNYSIGTSNSGATYPHYKGTVILINNNQDGDKLLDTYYHELSHYIESSKPFEDKDKTYHITRGETGYFAYQTLGLYVNDYFKHSTSDLNAYQKNLLDFNKVKTFTNPSSLEAELVARVNALCFGVKPDAKYCDNFDFPESYNQTFQDYNLDIKKAYSNPDRKLAKIFSRVN